MLKIWGRTNSSNVQKVLWGCGEMDIAFERIDAGLHFGRNREPEYLAMNPNGLVPTVEDGKVIIWESNTILRYLAAKSGKEPIHPKDPVERTLVERWMDWQNSHLSPPMAVLLFGFYRTAPEKRDGAALETAHRRSIELWSIIEGQLKDKKPYLAAKELSLADICVGIFVHRWYNYPVERPHMPHLRAWYDRLAERPAYRRHVLLPVS